jgi:FtsP/CotA-like multicopper oxidase with cupredoxin domain
MAPLSFIHKILLLASTLTSFTQALTIPSNNKRQSCENGPGSRNCWSDGFDIDTNYYNSWPDTGNTVSYDLHVTDTFCNPDGSGGKICQLINGQTPGPVIHAQWGDTISVTVHNELNYNGTAIHWHGIRQLHTNEQDGTNGVTECPTPPGTSKTYTFKATQYGTTWYHSHHTAQYGQGVVGAIVIDGPSTANYDEDLGVLPLTDWYYKSVYELLPGIMTIPGPPAPPDTVLVNGTMVDGNGNGQYQKLNVQPGKKYRLRFVNTAMDHLFHVSLDGHPFTVIEADFVPIQPYQTTDLKINVGQRYDVVFEANQNSGNYWLRVGSPAPGPGGALICGGAVVYSKNTTVVGAIVSYEGSGETWPTSSGYANDGSCRDEVIAPHFTTPMSGGYKLDALNITLTGPSSKVVNWFVNGSSMNSESLLTTLIHGVCH